MDRNGCVSGLVGVLRSAPGSHPNPLPSNGRGGMFVADECVAAVKGVWMFGWQGRFETCPYVGRVASLDRNGCRWVGVARPRFRPGPSP